MKSHRYQKSLRKHWDDKRQMRTVLGKAGLVSMVTVKGRIQVSSPYDTEFIVAARTLEGRWRKRSQCWSIPVEHRAALEDALRRIYGWQPGGHTDRMVACNHRYLRGLNGSTCLHCGQPEPL